ncbi:MFS transporter [Candidatus Trichorickettsia mobilis]|uniref:MFS transporter n=1 Tax=Candidatus Trichorickettsia mobilis TaxID=1346319 RepID=A0ABZ0USX7_9RICK|nr:MFS transporter [Candidatus Trichorickettsia mobilis]WPY01129.1 MFS transporter [Candidatus Trichorickettsia mobilis]
MLGLNKEQKECIGLLSIGTFLEYFDLMLYVHMAVLLNELFFPTTDAHAAKLISAFAFCSVFVTRPIGALLFGYIGDNIGRRATVIITTTMMACSCIVMANLPTYEQIGISAAWIVTICRVVQGMSSMGEIVGAELYMTEITKPPVQYPVTTIIAVFSVIGGNVALGVASLVTSFGFNWRIAFWIGAGVAVIGAIARTRLRETPDFVDFKRKAKKYLEELNRTPEHIEAVLNYPTFQEKANKITLLSLFLIQCSWPVCFYFVYIHCGHILKDSFGYSAEQVIHQNFIVSMMNLLGYLIITYLSYIIHPLKIIKVKLIIFSIFILICPYLLSNIKSADDLFLIQSFIMLFVLSAASAMSVMYSHIPIFRRFTYAGLMFALSRAVMHVITSFGLVYLIEYFGHWGLLVIMVPVCIGFGFAVSHFEKLEIEAGNL